MPTTDKMVGENKGKKGKEPRLSSGILGTVPMNMGTATT